MKKTFIWRFATSLIATAMVVFGAAIPTNATAGVTIDAPVPTFYQNSATPVFSITFDNGAAIPGGIYVQIGGWTMNPSCGASPEAIPSTNCGITSVTAVGGGTVTSPQVQLMGGQYRITWTGTTSAVNVAFASGAWTTNAASSKTLTVVGNAGPQTTTINVSSGSAPTPTPSPSATTEDPTLVNTGFDAQPYFLVSSIFGVLGVATLLIRARRRQQS